MQYKKGRIGEEERGLLRPGAGLGSWLKKGRSALVLPTPRPAPRPPPRPPCLPGPHPLPLALVHLLSFCTNTK